MQSKGLFELACVGDRVTILMYQLVSGCRIDKLSVGVIRGDRMKDLDGNINEEVIDVEV